MPVCPSGRGAAPAALVSMDIFCRVLMEIMRTVSLLLRQCTRCIHEEAYAALALGHLDQLLSCPEALRVAVCCGLSAEVQAAARGGDAAASECMATVHHQFALWAYLLQTQVLDSADGPSHREVVEEKLADFLCQAEVLPFLELLCLPLDPGGYALCILKLGPVLTSLIAVHPKACVSWSCCACRWTHMGASAPHTGSFLLSVEIPGM
jgi:hypothetical protein